MAHTLTPFRAIAVVTTPGPHPISRTGEPEDRPMLSGTGERPAGAFLIDPAIDGSVGVDLFPVWKRGTKMLLDERVVRQAMAGCPGVATCAIEAHTSRLAC